MEKQELERESELIREIAEAIVSDENFMAADWESLAQVAVVRDDSTISMHGFYYDANGKPTAETPAASVDISRKFLELRQAMKATHGGEWKSALIQIRRANKKVSTHFEYDDKDRWKVTPANLETMREELRPKDN